METYSIRTVRDETFSNLVIFVEVNATFVTDDQAASFEAAVRDLLEKS